MKKIFYLMMCLLTLTFVACDKPAPEEDVDFFTISVSEVTATSALVEVTPLDTTVTYYFDLLEKDVFMRLLAADSVVLYEVDYFDAVIDYYSAYGLTYDDFLSTDFDDYEFTKLAPATEYVAFAFTLDATTLASGKLQFVEFSTLEVQASDLTFDVQVTDTALWFLPSNKDEHYFVTLVAVDTLTKYNFTPEAYGDAALEQYVAYYGTYFTEYCTYTDDIYCTYDILDLGVCDFLFCPVTDGVRTGEWFVYTYDPTVAPVTAPRKSMKHVTHRFGKQIAVNKMVVK